MEGSPTTRLAAGPDGRLPWAGFSWQLRGLGGEQRGLMVSPKDNEEKQTLGLLAPGPATGCQGSSSRK